MKKQYKLSEFQFYDGEELITFNLIAINTEKERYFGLDMSEVNNCFLHDFKH